MLLLLLLHTTYLEWYTQSITQQGKKPCSHTLLHQKGGSHDGGIYTLALPRLAVEITSFDGWGQKKGFFFVTPFITPTRKSTSNLHGTFVSMNFV